MTESVAFDSCKAGATGARLQFTLKSLNTNYSKEQGEEGRQGRSRRQVMPAAAGALFLMPESMQCYFATTLLRILEKQVSVCVCVCAVCVCDVCVCVCVWLVLALLIVVLAVLFATFVVAMSFD